MPCYDPPPPWEGKNQKNAEQAARLLCKIVGAAIDTGQYPPRELLEWFIEHREIDAMIASDGYYGRLDPSEAARARADIERAKALLKSA